MPSRRRIRIGTLHEPMSFLNVSGRESASPIEDAGAWARAEQLARRIQQLSTVPMRSENHPTWDPQWRRAIENGLSSIGTGDADAMERALNEIERLARTL